MRSEDLELSFINYLHTLNQDRTNLIPALQQCQTIFGYVPTKAIEQIALYFKISEAEVYGVVSFYEYFKLKPIGKYVIRVCVGTACHVNGASMLIDTLQDELKIQSGDTTEDGLFSLFTVACLGCCSLAPAMMINDKTYGKLTPSKIKKIIKQYKTQDIQVYSNIILMLRPLSITAKWQTGRQTTGKLGVKYPEVKFKAPYPCFIFVPEFPVVRALSPLIIPELNLGLPPLSSKLS